MHVKGFKDKLNFPCTYSVTDAISVFSICWMTNPRCVFDKEYSKTRVTCRNIFISQKIFDRRSFHSVILNNPFPACLFVLSKLLITQNDSPGNSITAAAGSPKKIYAHSSRRGTRP